MRWKLLALVLFVLPAIAVRGQTPPGPANQQKTAEDTCAISGMVIRRDDSAPLKGAIVQLLGEDREHTIATKSTADGKFELKNVPAGQYRIMVTRNGYFRLEYGQKKPSDPGAKFTLRPGQRMSDLLFKLGRAGVITGHVYDEDGEPMPRAMLFAQRMVYEEGHRELQPETQAESNDLGEFRLFGLSPGRYYISAENPHWNDVVGERQFSGGDKSAGDKGYTKTYYPNAVDPGRASAIVVREGEEIPSIDFLMKENTVYRIRGKIMNTVSKNGSSNSWVQAVPRNQRIYWVVLGSQNGVKKDGSFEIADVPPGAYTVIARLFDEGKSYTAQQDVDVTAADVDGVILTIGQGLTISGRIVWEGNPSLSNESPNVHLSSEGGGYWNGGRGSLGENNQFTLKDISEGTFKVGVSGLSKDCYIKEVRYGDTTLADTELHIGKGGSGDLEITVSSRGARIEGTVLTDDNLPAAGYWVVAVPEESKRKFERLYKAEQTDQNGAFAIRGLAPGSYKLFSWDSVERGAWEDPDFLQPFESKGESVTVGDGDAKRAGLKLLSSKESASKSE